MSDVFIKQIACARNSSFVLRIETQSVWIVLGTLGPHVAIQNCHKVTVTDSRALCLSAYGTGVHPASTIHK